MHSFLLWINVGIELLTYCLFLFYCCCLRQSVMKPSLVLLPVSHVQGIQSCATISRSDGLFSKDGLGRACKDCLTMDV